MFTSEPDDQTPDASPARDPAAAAPEIGRGSAHRARQGEEVAQPQRADPDGNPHGSQLNAHLELAVGSMMPPSAGPASSVGRGRDTTKIPGEQYAAIRATQLRWGAVGLIASNSHRPSDHGDPRRKVS